MTTSPQAPKSPEPGESGQTPKGPSPLVESSAVPPAKRRPKARCRCDAYGLAGCPSCQKIIERRRKAEARRIREGKQ